MRRFWIAGVGAAIPMAFVTTFIALNPESARIDVVRDAGQAVTALAAFATCGWLAQRSTGRRRGAWGLIALSRLAARGGGARGDHVRPLDEHRASPPFGVGLWDRRRAPAGDRGPALLPADTSLRHRPSDRPGRGDDRAVPHLHRKRAVAARAVRSLSVAC